MVITALEEKKEALGAGQDVLSNLRSGKTHLNPVTFEQSSEDTG